MSPNSAPHETHTQSRPVKAGSDRSFGLVFAAVFLAVGLLPLIRGHEARWWSVAVAFVFLALALALPGTLKHPNRLWFRFGLLLHTLTNPIVMGALFFGVITPAALLMRLFGQDPLRKTRDADASSYWTLREPPGPAPDSLKNQF